MGSGVDIHKQILKIAPYSGLTIPGHNYTGPGNPLEDQRRHDSEGNWKKRQWGHALARTMINTKQKLGLGLNARRR